MNRLRKKRLLAGFEPMAHQVRVRGAVEGRYLVLEKETTDEFGETHVKSRGRMPIGYIRNWVRAPNDPNTVLVVELPGTDVLDTLDAFKARLSSAPCSAVPPAHPPGE